MVVEEVGQEGGRIAQHPYFCCESGACTIKACA